VGGILSERDLKECPFCKKPGKLFKAPLFGSDNPYEYYDIGCETEDCFMGGGTGGYAADEKEIEDLIKTWNNRTP